MAVNVIKFVPTRAQLIEGIRHVVYEYGNLMAAGHFSISIEGKAPWRTNCDDAFLLGCRKLGDFLLSKGRSKRCGQELDDILALDYLPQNFIQTWELPVWSNEWRDAMNKQLAHISYTRTKVWVHETWVPSLLKEFNGAYWDFQDAITNQDFRAEFDRQFQECQSKEGFKNNIDLRRR
jgi:hypothetical protein